MQTAAMTTLSRPSFLGAGRPAAAGRTIRARQAFRVCASDRVTWYPGSTSPKYLDGSLRT